MTDTELRVLVRDAVARHLGRPEAPALAAERPPAGAQPAEAPEARRRDWHAHASHYLYVALVNLDSACVIEPTVSCDHCGYCKSHGH